MGRCRWALIPYNGREFIQYYAFLKAARGLGVERVMVVNQRGHIAALDDLDRVIREMRAPLTKRR